MRKLVEFPMLRYKAGCKFVNDGVHAQVLDLPAVITCGTDHAETRRLLAMALVDVTETQLVLGQPLPNPQVTNPPMDIEEPIYLHLSASTEVAESPAGVIDP